MKPLHEKLKELRDEKGWSLRGVAKLIPISHTAYGKYETGESHPTWPQIERLAIIYEISPIQLVHHEVVTLKGLEHQHKIDDIFDALSSMNKELQNLKSEIEDLQDLKDAIEGLQKLIAKKTK